MVTREMKMPPDVTGKIKGRAKILTGLQRTIVFLQSFLKKLFVVEFLKISPFRIRLLLLIPLLVYH